MAENPSRWWLLAVALLLLMVSIQSAFLTAKGFPFAPLFATVRLGGMDDTAAARWQSANPPGMITIKPDTPTRDKLVKTLPPIALGLVVMALALLA